MRSLLLALVLHFAPVSAPRVQAAAAVATVCRAADVTRVSLDFASSPTARIDPNLFGNFIEHLPGAIYGTVWANALQNPDLEASDAREEAPWGWQLNGVGWVTGGRDSLHAVRLPPGHGTLQQRTWLPAHRTRRYIATLYARSSSPGGTVVARLLAPAAAGDEVLCSRAARVDAGAWHRLRLDLVLPDDHRASPRLSQFSVSAVGAATVDVDRLSLFPDDAVHGFDPEVLQRARDLRIPILRLGGNFSSGYHWRDGIGPRDTRPTLRNNAWGGIESNEFGTDEYLDLCHLVGARPQICVNAGSGTPDEAAQWVAYCKLRQPRTMIWEIGNELYGDWQIGHAASDENARRYSKFRRAMVAQDPDIRIIATGRGEQFTGEAGRARRDWNGAIFVEAGMNPPDYLSLHPLVPLPGIARGYSYAETYESAMAHPAALEHALIPSVVQQIVEMQGAATKIAVTEWGIIYGGAGWLERPNTDVLAGAIYNALALNAFMRSAAWVQLANMTALTHGGGIKRHNGVVFVDPQYYTQQLFTAARPRALLPVHSYGPWTDVPQRGGLPAAHHVPDVDVAAARNPDGHIVLFLVNRTLDSMREVEISVRSFRITKMAAQILTAPDPQARNTPEQPNTVKPEAFVLRRIPASGSLTAVLPPHSFVLATLEGRKTKLRKPLERNR